MEELSIALLVLGFFLGLIFSMPTSEETDADQS